MTKRPRAVKDGKEGLDQGSEWTADDHCHAHRRQECTRKVMKTTLIEVMVRSILSQGMGHGRSGCCRAEDKEDGRNNMIDPESPCTTLSMSSDYPSCVMELLFAKSPDMVEVAALRRGST